ncbi:MAG TPA: NADH-quinone oxidoreductase subunit K [Chitinophagaceae bacterium]|nr:NADH-quinone oxidoreductase subunit K [Chitinophagaceae bacterium]
MTNVLLIIFTITLLYLGIAHRLLTYVKILAFQGVILFGIAFLELIQINAVNLAFVLLETIVFKAIAIPLFLNYVMKRNRIARDAEPFLPNFISLIIITLIIIVTFILANAIAGSGISKIYFVVAVSTLFTGLYLIVTRHKIITHVMGYLVIENGVFILSLAVGNSMPMLVNLGILLDVFASVFLLGIFVNRIGDVLKDVDVDQLKNLKD